ncbi:DUF2442 domain-containing protein [Pleomorphovibrio marinus]|uniref:DUF2442 domain-containing protein n=1 Tax=Pleomorphovibrio marinus TaxID=2164132 RepID=UPI000E0B2E97|nr:DUF2442 domain-containing protein [Pleomorphovibrio marinus]
MDSLVNSPSIVHVQFKGDILLEIDLDNGRSFVVPLEKFPEIKALTKSERDGFEVIDGSNLSFLAIDKLLSIKELIGVY